MKLITAIVKPFTLPEIRQALEQQEVRGLTVTCLLYTSDAADE